MEDELMQAIKEALAEVSQEDIAGLDPELIVYSEALEFVKEDASLPEAEEILNNWNQY